MVLVLFETATGFALFRLLDDGLLKRAEDVAGAFESSESAASAIQLEAFTAFSDITNALSAATGIIDGELSKPLKKFLKKNIVKKELSDKLAVSDAKLGGLIKDKLGIKCVADSAVFELMRGVRSQISSLLEDVTEQDIKNMQLGVAHSLSRYKLKFSPDKVDTMIVQAISLLDELDKELNTYAMRVREWYGWHFPELSKLISEHQVYANLILNMGRRTDAAATDLEEYVAEELVDPIRLAAKVSMGTEISDFDLQNIQFLAQQVLSISQYRTELYEYLKNRMNAIAPNLTALVGELVGARLIAHTGSLINLSKQPASTVQILGAEKALFRALKTKSATPKYGLLYHASIVGQASAKNKGKISRVLAAKAALAIRCDALGDEDTPMIGLESRAKIEARLMQLEGKSILAQSAASGISRAPKAYAKPSGVSSYNANADVAMDMDSSEEEDKKKKKKKKDKAKSKKRKSRDDDSDSDEPASKAAKHSDEEDTAVSKAKSKSKDKKKSKDKDKKKSKSKDKKKSKKKSKKHESSESS